MTVILKPVHVKIPARQYLALRAHAAAERKPMSAIIHEWIKTRLDKITKDYQEGNQNGNASPPAQAK